MTEVGSEVVIDIESTVELVGCSTCGTSAQAQERMPAEIRDLACFGPAAPLVLSGAHRTSRLMLTESRGRS